MNVIDLIEIKHLKGEQKELAETIGIESYRKLVTHYGGERVFIPRLDSIVSSNRKSLITSALKTESEADIMKFFCMTKREFERFKLGCK